MLCVYACWLFISFVFAIDSTTYKT
jgi:hypothetical protein